MNISNIVSESWQLLSKNFVTVLLTFIVFVILDSLDTVLVAFLPESAAGLSALISIAGLFASGFLTAGLYRFGLNIVEERNPDIGDLFSQSPSTALKVIGASILYFLIVAVGFVLLIIPGIIWSLKFSMVFQILIDQNVGPIEALSRSSQLTDGNKLNLFLLGLVNAGIVLLGVLCLGIGLIVAAPLVWLTLFVAYKSLQPGRLITDSI